MPVPTPRTLVDAAYKLEKFPSKGGWTYAYLPEIQQDPTAPFGWKTVRGRIDDYALEKIKLMPMGEGRLFLPVKAAIRKAIGKEAGDRVHIVLYPDNLPLLVPEVIQDCLDEVPAARVFFDRLTENERKAYLDWVAAAKTDPTRVQRIATLLERLEKEERFYDRS